MQIAEKNKRWVGCLKNAPPPSRVLNSRCRQPKAKLVPPDGGRVAGSDSRREAVPTQRSVSFNSLTICESHCPIETRVRERRRESDLHICKIGFDTAKNEPSNVCYKRLLFTITILIYIDEKLIRNNCNAWNPYLQPRRSHL